MKTKKKDEDADIVSKEKFREMRLALNMNQTDLANALGYRSYLTVVAKENGKRGIHKGDMIILKTLKPLKKTLRIFKTKTKK